MTQLTLFTVKHRVAAFRLGWRCLPSPSFRFSVLKQNNVDNISPDYLDSRVPVRQMFSWLSELAGREEG